MITSQDRSGWFGASDTKYIMRDNHSTKSWIEWWEVKLGAKHSGVSNKYTYAGTIFEHPILESIDTDIRMDGQIIIEDLKIRVNYDGYKDGVIYEVKTFDANNEFTVKKEYWQQCQIEMYVYMQKYKQWFLPEFKRLEIVSYPLYEDDYNTNEPMVDPNRVSRKVIEYDEKFIKDYLKRVKRLARCLDKGKFPG